MCLFATTLISPREMPSISRSRTASCASFRSLKTPTIVLVWFATAICVSSFLICPVAWTIYAEAGKSTPNTEFLRHTDHEVRGRAEGMCWSFYRELDVEHGFHVDGYFRECVWSQRPAVHDFSSSKYGIL